MTTSRTTGAISTANRVRPTLTFVSAVGLLLSGFWPSQESLAGLSHGSLNPAAAQVTEASDGLAAENSHEPESPSARKETGEQVAEQCNQCHGEGGHSETPDIPSIAGFSMLATMDLLDTYRMGLRQARTVTLPDGSETNMEEVADALSDADEFSVVIYYANRKWRPHEQPFDADLARRGAEVHAERCEKCHYEGGRDPSSDLPISAGQWREYLVAEFDNFDAGRRAMSDKMREKYDTLSASDKQAIIELYVSTGNF